MFQDKDLNDQMVSIISTNLAVIEKAAFVSDIDNEINFIERLVNINFANKINLFPCTYIFNKSTFTNVYTGMDIKDGQASGQLNITEKFGLATADLHPCDILIRAGQLAGFVKTYFYDDKHLIHHKYTESNTYSKTLRLGIKVHVVEIRNNTRGCFYIKLVEGLKCIRKALIQSRERPITCSQPLFSPMDKVYVHSSNVVNRLMEPTSSSSTSVVNEGDHTSSRKRKSQSQSETLKRFVSDAKRELSDLNHAEGAFNASNMGGYIR